MVVEIAGARIMAPAYGLSAVPWTAVIGVVLAGLAAGNALGGRWADRGRFGLPWILVGAGVTALLPVVLSGVPAAARDAIGFIPGAVVSALLLFAPPVFALGMVVPWLVRASAESVETVGRHAGDVSAAATVGSILGTFATGFLLLPLLPLPLLLGCTGAGLLLLAAFAGVLFRDGPGSGMLVVAAVAVGTVGALEPATDGVIHREETLYGSIQVTERVWTDGRVVRELWQNGGSSSAEVAATGAPAHPYATLSLELLAPVAGRLDSVAVLGGGALTLPVALARGREGRRVEVVELDPAVTRLARDFFAYGRLDDASENVAVTHGDARRWLETTRSTYDLVYLDVFDNLVTVPWHLVTVEALEGVRDRLEPDGLVVANVLSPREGPGALFLRRLLATFGEAFEAVRAYPVRPEADPEAIGNVLVVAARTAAALPPTRRAEVDVRPLGPPLTDAHAPVEYLQARVFWGGLRWR